MSDLDKHLKDDIEAIKQDRTLRDKLVELGWTPPAYDPYAELKVWVDQGGDIAIKGGDGNWCKLRNPDHTNWTSPAECYRKHDPYRKFKEALQAGKRVRFQKGAWCNTASDFSFNCPPSDYEIEPDKPTLYCGHTAEQWQFVIDGEFDVKVSDSSLKIAYNRKSKYKLQSLDVKMGEVFIVNGCNWKYCHIVREKRHPQPAFGRDELNDDVLVAIHCTGGIDDTRLRYAPYINWKEVDWFIEL